MAATSARRMGVNIFDDTKPLWRIMVVFLVPLMLSNVLQTASQTFGAIFLGRMLGTQALAAVSCVFPVFFFLISFLFGIGSGATVLIGQAYGAKDEALVKRIAGTVLSATLLLAFIVAIVGTMFAPHMLKLLGTPDAILGRADLYARWIFLTAPVIFPYVVYTMFLRGVGDSQTPFYFLIISSILSISLTPAFIAGFGGLPKLDVAALAASAFIAQGVAFAALLIYLRARKNWLQFDSGMLRGMIIDPALLLKVIRIGIPAGLQMVMVSLAEIAVISFVNRYGATATAAYGAVNQVASYVQFPAMSIGIASSIFGAQCIGARREDKLGAVVHSGAGLNYIVGAVLIALCYIFSYQILGWFLVEPGTLEIAHQLLMITLWGYVLFGNSAVLSGLMRSSGDVIVPTAISIFGVWGVEVPAAFILMQHYGLDGVWMGYPIAFAVTLALQFSYYKLFWKKKTHERLV